MRVAIALAISAGCSFEHGIAPGTGSNGDANVTDSASQKDGGPNDAGMTDASTKTPLLQHDFENDLIGPFTDIYLMDNDSVNHASVAHSGSKSAQCSTASPADAQATLYYDFSTRAQMYASMWIRLASGFPPSDYVMIMAFVDDPQGAAWNNVAQVAVFPDMRVGIFNNTTLTNHFSTATLAPATWHRIEVVVKVSATTGRLMLALDGVVQFDMTGINTGTLQFHKILTGIAWQGAPSDPTTLYVDDVRLE